MVHDSFRTLTRFTRDGGVDVGSPKVVHLTLECHSGSLCLSVRDLPCTLPEFRSVDLCVSRRVSLDVGCCVLPFSLPRSGFLDTYIPDLTSSSSDTSPLSFVTVQSVSYLPLSSPRPYGSRSGVPFVPRGVRCNLSTPT